MRKPASMELGFVPVWDHGVHITQIPYQTATHMTESVLLTFLIRNMNNPKPMPHIMHIKLYKIYNIIVDWMPRNSLHLQSTMKV